MQHRMMLVSEEVLAMALQFLQRVQIQGAEAGAYLQCMQQIQQSQEYVPPPIPVSPPIPEA